MGTVIVSLGVVLVYGLITVRAEPLNTYSVTGENNGYDYSNSVSNGGYIGNKDIQRGGTLGNSVGNNIGSTSYNTFSPDGHGSGFTGYSSNNHENFGGSAYSLQSQISPSFATYSAGSNSNSNNKDYNFEDFTSHNHGTSDLTSQHYSTGNREPGYFNSPVYSTSLSGSSFGSIPDGSASGFRETSGGVSTLGGYSSGDQGFLGSSSHSSSLSNGEYTFGKQKERPHSYGGSNKYENDVYSSSSSDMRYIRGSQATRNHGSVAHLPSSGSNIHFPAINSGPTVYSPGRVNKYNKYITSTYSSPSVSYPSRDHEMEHIPGSYIKNSGKVIITKDSGPGSYSSYTSRSPYTNGNYKSKLSSLISSHNAGYSLSPNFSGGYSTDNHGTSHLHRGYGSSSGHGNVYSSYS